MGPTAAATVRVDDAELYHEVRGAGPPLLMIPGATGDAGYLAPVADHLADEFTVVTYDRRGNSRSSRPPGWTKTSTAEQSDDAAGLLELLGSAPAAVFGTSGGAIIALDLLVRYPHLVRCAVLHEPPMISVLQRPEEVATTLQGVIEGGMRRGGPPAAAGDFLDHVSAGAIDCVDAVVRGRMLANAETFFDIEFGVFESYRVDDSTLSAIKAPVTLTTGRETLAFFREATTWLAAKLGADVEEVPGGHTPHFDKPREFAEAIRRFLRTPETHPGGRR